jgi:hypothetical protein
MWGIFLLLLLPPPLSVRAEDLGKRSTIPAGLSGSFGLTGFSGSSGGGSDSTNKASETD